MYIYSYIIILSSILGSISPSEQLLCQAQGMYPKKLLLFDHFLSLGIDFISIFNIWICRNHSTTLHHPGIANNHQLFGQ